ncbi:hypothetical protein RMR21_016695 [Agrobacterium sp. rho-8.1]|nr:hypothetical protein [Agrobacterium sp. rho-8.1]
MPASNILTGFEIQALPLLSARRRVYRQLIGSWSNATARSLKRKSGGTQANAASAGHPRKGAKADVAELAGGAFRQRSTRCPEVKGWTLNMSDR